MGEFAWSAIEPAQGRIELEWLDEAIGILAAQRLEVVLGTPTAAPPAWLVEIHPDIQPTDVDGHLHRFGNRRHYCPNHPAFHDATDRIVGALATRFGGDSRVIGWQIDNEFGGYCYCSRCRSAFQQWLRERYRSLDDLNAAWGTSFWSQTYTTWEQIPVPQREPLDPNPGLALDYRRFMSDSYVRYQSLQTARVRERSEDQFLTHNFMGFKFRELDYALLAAGLDFVSWDNYPGLDPQASPLAPALAAAAMRGLKRRKTWVMEQQAGSVGWGAMLSPAPAQVRLWTYQAVAHGAEAVLFFRWRTARFGTEQHWHGILDADGTARRRYQDLRRLSVELGRLGHLLHAATPRIQVALVHDYDSRFALQTQPTNAALAYESTVLKHYEALRGLGLGVDVQPDLAGLEHYRLVVAPSLYVCDDEKAQALSRYVQGGGTLVLAPRTAVKDRFNAVPEAPLPAGLDELCGLRVTDYRSAGADTRVRIGGRSLEGEFEGWFEELELDGADTLATYLDGAFAGSPAIASHNSGDGLAVYIGGAATTVTLEAIFRHLAGELGLDLLELPPGVEAVRLEGTGNGELLVLLNHTERKQEVDLGGRRWHELLNGARGAGEIDVAPHDVAVIESVQ